MTVFETLDSERRRKWRQYAIKQVFCFLEMPGGALLNYKCPAPGTNRASNSGGGGDARGWN